MIARRPSDLSSTLLVKFWNQNSLVEQTWLIPHLIAVNLIAYSRELQNSRFVLSRTFSVFSSWVVWCAILFRICFVFVINWRKYLSSSSFRIFARLPLGFDCRLTISTIAGRSAAWWHRYPLLFSPSASISSHRMYPKNSSSSIQAVNRVCVSK